jgi:phage minor structural protein
MDVINKITSGAMLEKPNGILRETVSGIVTESDDAYCIDIRYPLSGACAKTIRLDDMLIIMDRKSRAVNYWLQAQVFRVASMERDFNCWKIHADHISRDLDKQAVLPFEAVQGAAIAKSRILSRLQRTDVASCPLVIQTDSTNTTSTFAFMQPRTAMEALHGKEGSFRDVFGGTLSFDNMTARFMSQDNTVKGLIRYGVNMTSFSWLRSFDGFYTGVIGWASRGEDQPAVFSDEQWWTSYYHTKKTLLVDFSDKFEDGEIEADLAAAKAKLNELAGHRMNWKKWSDDTPSIKVGYIDTGDQGTDDMRLGDLAVIVDPWTGEEYTMRVTGRTYDIMRRRTTSYEFGKARKTAAKRIAALRSNA